MLEQTKDLINQLNCEFRRCSDCLLTDEYVNLLKSLRHRIFDRELIEFLCDKTTSKKHIWEIRFKHLATLLTNEFTKNFDLKQFFLENVKKSRRLPMKLYFIRGFAIYATEAELKPLMDKFSISLTKIHDYIDYEHILSVAGLPYLVEKYHYQTFIDSLKTAEEEYLKIDPLLRGFFTINEEFEQINLIDNVEVSRRTKLFLERLK